MPKKLALAEKLDRFPPVVVRLLARQPAGTTVTALPEGEIVRRSGLSAGEVRVLSRLTSWDDVPLSTMLAFCRGCGADLDNRDWLRKNAAYMASIRGAPRYLRKDSAWDTTFEPLIRILLRHSSRETHRPS